MLPTDDLPPPSTLVINAAAAVQWLGCGILLLGPSGSGKSDLALRMIDDGGRLIADDLVRLTATDDILHATAPALPGHIEMRGLGIFKVAHQRSHPLHLAVLLRTNEEMAAAERLPEPSHLTFLGRDLPSIMLDPFQVSALARLKVVLQARRIDDGH